MTSHYEISSATTGHILGIYTAESEEAAIVAMAREAGYGEDVIRLDHSGDLDGAFLDDDQYAMVAPDDLDVREMPASGLICVCDLYDADGTVPYDSADEFIDMCERVFGETPDLRERDGEYYVGGILVLTPAGARA